jgi:SAM-dependent methyltransferase
MLPFRFGSNEEFAAVRGLLIECRYTEPEVCERAGVPAIHQFVALGRGRETATEIVDALDVLIRLFLDGLPVEASLTEALLSRAGVEALEALAILGHHPDHPEAYAASVLLYPTASLYIASDLDAASPGRMRPEELEKPDHVFAATTTLTGNFIGQLPTSACGHFLELCAGTGIAALAASRFADHAWAVDITERSTAFALFNARLNGIGNVTALRGDLFEPVAGMTFDRIAAHPPYVPAQETRFVYRDAGEEGESVLRRILAGLPDHLGPGGRFYCTCVSTDRRGAPLERRIRDMIGEQEGAFDLLLVVHYEMHPTEYYSRQASAGRISFETVGERHALYRSLGAERIVYCSMVLQRHAVRREPFTLRRQRSERATGDDADALMTWATRVAEDGGLPAALLDARASVAPGVVLESTHRVGEEGWTVATCRARVAQPFAGMADLSPNASLLLPLFDGSQTTRAILARLREGGAIPAEMPETAFAEFVRELVGSGILVVNAEADARPEEVPRRATAG